MRPLAFRFVVIALVVALGAVAGRLTAQGTRTPQTEEVLPALLVEVRGLRAAMEQMASAGPRVQLALGRLQLQEQRVNTMLRRLETLRDSLASARADLTDKQDQVTRIENALKTKPLPPEEREEIENHLKGLRRDLVRPSAEVLRLTAEEASLASDIAAEQARWADVNQRLEELERALTRR